MDPQEPIINLKLELEKATGVPAHEQAFYYNGCRKGFEDDKIFLFEHVGQISIVTYGDNGHGSPALRSR